MGHHIASSRWQDLIEQAREVNLPVVAAQLGFELRREGRTYRIPGYGGLILWSGSDGLWRWTHFSAGKGGDPIAFVQEWGGLNFWEAVAYLTGQDFFPSGHKASPQKRSPRPGKPTKEPGVDWTRWRAKTRAFLEWAHEQLMGPEGEAVRRWLAEKRGIDMETAQRFKLGFCPREIWRKRSDWGLPLENKDRLWLPPGLVIPYQNLQGELVGLQFRLFKPNKAKKYGLPSINTKIRFYFVSPGKRPIYLIGKPGEPLVILESELDAILLARLSHDCDVSLAALGSAGRKPRIEEDMEFFLLFLSAPAVLLALDNDEAGRKAPEWWTKRYKHVLYWPITEAKDPGELWKAQGHEAVRKWLTEGLERVAALAGKDWQALEPIKRAWFFIEVDRLARPIPFGILSQLSDEEIIERFFHHERVRRPSRWGYSAGGKLSF